MPPDGDIDPAELQRQNERLRADLELERRRASENEARADTLDHQVSQSSARIHSAQLAQLQAQEQAADDAVKATANEIAGLKAQLATLQAEGKFQEAADVQEQIGDAAARRQQALQAKGYFAQQRTSFPATPMDPVERFLSDNQGTYSAEDMAWIRQNRRFATDAAFRGRVIQAHGEALQSGIRQRSAEYYQHIENAAYLRPSAPPELPQPEQRQAQPAPTGAGEGGEEPYQPEIRIIRDQDMDQRFEPEPEAFNRHAERPQQRAAGNGSMRAAVAAPPSRRLPMANDRRTILTLTEGERDSAVAMAPYLAEPEVLQGGLPAILNWYNDLKESAAARRIRNGWGNQRI